MVVAVYGCFFPDQAVGCDLCPKVCFWHSWLVLLCRGVFFLLFGGVFFVLCRGVTFVERFCCFCRLILRSRTQKI